MVMHCNNFYLFLPIIILIPPGAIETDVNRELKENKDEVANVVEFLASDKAIYVTGTIFFVYGMTLYPSFSIEPEHDAKLHLIFRSMSSNE